MPYTQSSNNTRAYADMGTGVWIAAKGSTLPTTLDTDPAAPFVAAGWLSEEGITLNVEKDIKKHYALQGGSMVKQKITQVDQTISFECLEETALVLGLVYADQAITVTGTGPDKVAQQSISTAQNRSVERALVIDTVEGNVIDRYCFSAVDLTFQGEIALSHPEDLRVYKFEGAVVAGAAAYHITNSPGVIGTP